MTLKTINRHAGGDMATGAKVLVIIYAGNLAVRSRCRVAINTLGKTGFFSADAVVNRLIALMHEHAHMRTAHFIYRRNTGITDWLRYNITRVIAIGAVILCCD